MGWEMVSISHTPPPHTPRSGAATTAALSTSTLFSHSPALFISGLFALADGVYSDVRNQCTMQRGRTSGPPPTLAAGMRKATFKTWVRRLGTFCAVLQLGTAFAASRALFVSEVRQRLVAMDLRCYLANCAVSFCLCVLAWCECAYICVCVWVCVHACVGA